MSAPKLGGATARKCEWGTPDGNEAVVVHAYAFHKHGDGEAQQHQALCASCADISARAAGHPSGLAAFRLIVLPLDGFGEQYIIGEILGRAFAVLGGP